MVRTGRGLQGPVAGNTTGLVEAGHGREVGQEMNTHTALPGSSCVCPTSEVQACRASKQEETEIWRDPVSELEPG